MIKLKTKDLPVEQVLLIDKIFKIRYFFFFPLAFFFFLVLAGFWISSVGGIKATASISTKALSGSALTATVDRAGFISPKYWP
jgi:hypothetical protein